MTTNSRKVLMSIFTLGVLYYLCNQQEIKENFAGMANTFRPIVVTEFEGKNNQFFSVPGTFQSSLAPRMSGGVDFGSNIRYNMPSANNMGVNPESPIGYANMVGSSNVCSCSRDSIQIKEGFCSRCNGAVGCRKGGGGTPANSIGPGTGPASSFALNNFNQVENSLQTVETTDMLPVQDMSNGVVVNALGEAVAQPVIYDRYIYANQKSRLYAQGDPIRGDLPIVPCKGQWFTPNVHPQIDLRDGALAVVGGVNNSTANELLALQSAASGGILDVGAGINYSVQKSSFLNPAGDIQVSAFP
jgi:hypothetical protein